MAEWITVKEASVILKVSERNIRFKISSGKLKAKREGKIWLIHNSLTKADADTEGIANGNDSGYRKDTNIIDILKQEIEKRDKQLDEKDRQISKLQEEVSEHSQRTDTIIMQLTRQLGDAQKAIEYKQISWWRRLKLGKGKDDDKT